MDAGEGVVEFLGDWPHAFHATWEADVGAVIVDESDGGDDGCGATESAFCKVAEFFAPDFALFGF